MVKMLSPVFPPRRPFGFVRLGLAAILLITLFYYLKPASYNGPAYLSDGTRAPPKRAHPIDRLIKRAETEYHLLLKKESKTLEAAAAAYRKRRGRHPPPGFREWFQFATERDAVVVEDFFDQIYHDLEPFWGLDAAVIRREAADFEMTINVRGGNATSGSDWFWTKLWLDMVKSIETLLPDMDIALNAMDEPRIVVPWEDIEGYMKKARSTRKMAKASKVIQMYGELPPRKEVEAGLAVRPKNMENTSESSRPSAYPVAGSVGC